MLGEQYTYVCMYTHTHTHTHIYIYIYMCMYIAILPCTLTWILCLRLVSGIYETLSLFEDDITVHMLFGTPQQ